MEQSQYEEVIDIGWASGEDKMIMDAGALRRAMKRHAAKGIAVAAAGVAATAIVTTTASATSSGQAPLHLTAKATAEVVITPCGTCVTSLPAGIHMGAVAEESGNLLNQHGTRVGHFALSATQVTPVTPTAVGELLLDVTLVLGNGQITAHGIEEPPDNAGTIAITGGTGHYQSAGGEIHFRDDGPGTTLLQVTIER